MVVLPDHSIIGTVGGGCGEAEVWQVAVEILDSTSVFEGPIYVHVDLTEDFQSENGKVCGGRFDVSLHLLEADRPQIQQVAEHMRTLFEAGQQFVLLRGLGLIPAPGWKKNIGERSKDDAGWVGWRVWDGNPQELKSIVDQQHLDQILRGVALAFETGTSQLVVCNSEPEVSLGGGPAYFLDCAAFQLRLIIAGAGHIARPLCEMATICGYAVTIIDDRPEYCASSYFPKASQVICQEFTEYFEQVSLDENTSIVLVTRGHKHDQDCLWRLRDRPVGYLGMIGSQRRVKAVMSDFEGKCSAGWLKSVHAPIGLKIGAQTPEEIAVCILAEMIGVRRGAIPKR